MQKFPKVYRNDSNKIELFKMNSEAVIKISETESKVVATIGNRLMANTSLHTSRLELCNPEEAGTRILLQT
jgi:hypothetical protein